MSLISVPFLYAGITNVNGRCIVCNELVSAEVEKSLTTERATLEKYAEQWKLLDVRVCDNALYIEFRNVSERLVNCQEQEKFIVHESCSTTFRTRLKRKKSQAEKLIPLQHENDGDPVEEIISNPANPRRLRRSRDESIERICFVCNESSDTMLSYNNGGVGRCSGLSSVKNIKDAKKLWLEEPNGDCTAAAQRLNIRLIGCDDDAFAADVFYHKICYNRFIRVLRQKKEDPTIKETSEIDDKVVSLFLNQIETKVVKDRNAYLLNQLCDDCREISKEFGLDDSPACLRYSYRMKETLIENFDDKIHFSKVGKYVAVHPWDVDPLTYTAATLKGRGLREESIVRCFANLVRRKLNVGRAEDVIHEEKQGKFVPPTIETFMAELDTFSPLKCIFNAISLSINPKRTESSDGYVKAASSAQAEKINAISECWERLLTNRRTPTATALSLTLHRITGSKEAVQLYHHAGLAISYDDVRRFTNKWAKEESVKHKGMLPSGFIKGKSAHVTFDNSDGKQQTLLGDRTTHHTNGTIFQLTNSAEEDPAVRFEEVESVEDCNEGGEDKINYGTFKIPLKRNRADPPPFPEFADKFKTSNLLELCLQRDIAWVLTGFADNIYQELNASLNDTLRPVGSWTAFMKDTSAVETLQCKLEYLPVVPLPPTDNVVKWYIDTILQMAEDLEIDHIFVHADEAIYSKMVMIMWLNGKKYDKLIPLIGGFHTLLVFLKIMYKKYGCMSLHQWWVSAGAIMDGSVVQAIEGKHYYRGIGLHKQSMNALLRCKIQENIPSDENLKRAILKLRLETNPENLQALLNLHCFKAYCEDLLKSDTGTQYQMMIQYVKDVSLLLALVSAVRERSIELHVVAERALLPKCFAFDHINYARYLTIQHINLERIQMHQSAAWDDLLTNGFGGSLSGQTFSTIHGDLITETTINRETKVRGGPMRGGFSTSEDTNAAFIKTSHLMAKIRSKLKKRLKVLTSAVHKEITTGARKRHDFIVDNLKRTLEGLMDPFLHGPARHILTGAEIEKSVIDGLLSSDKVGEACFQTFVKQRIIASDDTRVQFFESIKKNKIKTGMEKKKKDRKAVDILKEDRQAFGLLVGKVSSLGEALEYPITSVPLALSDIDRTLRSQSTKSLLRNEIISKAMAGKTIHDVDGVIDWYVDGMLVVRALRCKETWKDFADAVLSYCTPEDTANVRRLSIIFDSYGQPYIKQMTQMDRGFSSNRIYITSLKQKMPQGKAWDAFLENPENKTDLIEMITRRFSSASIRTKLDFELVVTQESETMLITDHTISELPPCNHIEADTRLILEATKSDNTVVIRSADTDVLMLMCYVHQDRNIQKDWFMMIDSETFVSIKDIRSHFGDEFCSILPAYHSITGCDTTSYPANVGKIKPFKKMLATNSMHLLHDLGKSKDSFRDLSASLTFYHTMMYGGKKNESITDTRVRMFKSQKKKSSVNLISDQASITQHLLRADLQCFIWRQCTLQTMVIPSLNGRGWVEIEDRIIPVWFEGNQLPPSLSRSKQRNSDTGNKNVAGRKLPQKKKSEPGKKKAKIDESSTCEYSSASTSSVSSSSSSSGGWEVWEDRDLESDASSDDPDW